MANIYDVLLGALRGHWKAHTDAYPQKFVLSPSQHRDLRSAIDSVRQGIAVAPDKEPMKFMGAKLEIRDGSPGLMVAVDGTETPLSAQ